MAEKYPDWIMEGVQTKRFLAWLTKETDQVARFSEWILLKGVKNGCVLVYHVPDTDFIMQEGFHSIELCGIFRKKDYSLYEVSPILYQAVGIPEEFGFPDKAEIQSEIEEKVTVHGRQKLQKEWDDLLIKSGFTREQLIPSIDREMIHLAAKRYSQMGKRAKDLVYVPVFSFDSIQCTLSDEIFLQYLENAEYTVKALTERWLTRMLADVSKKRIYYGCVREEMEELEKAERNQPKSKEMMKVKNAEKRSA